MSKKEAALIKLDGTIINTDGTTRKGNFFRFLDLNPDDYSDITYTPEEAKKIQSHLSHLVTGASAAIPLICAGFKKCPFIQQCPLAKIELERKKEDPDAKSVLPITKQCLVEINLLNEWTKLYIREYEIDENNFTEFQMIRELAEIELMLWRLNNNLAKSENAELIQDTVVGVDREGNPLTRKEVNSFIEAKEKLQNRKTKLVKLMVGDRQEKYKREAALKIREAEDPSSNAAQLRGKIDKLLVQAKELDIKVKEKEGNIIEADISPVSSDNDDVLTPEDLIDKE